MTDHELIEGLIKHDRIAIQELVKEMEIVAVKVKEPCAKRERETGPAVVRDINIATVVRIRKHRPPLINRKINSLFMIEAGYSLQPGIFRL